jgi:hypothetical protein
MLDVARVQFSASYCQTAPTVRIHYQRIAIECLVFHQVLGNQRTSQRSSVTASPAMQFAKSKIFGGISLAERDGSSLLRKAA